MEALVAALLQLSPEIVTAIYSLVQKLQATGQTHATPDQIDSLTQTAAAEVAAFENARPPASAVNAGE